MNVSLKEHSKNLFGALLDKEGINEIIINREGSIYYETSEGFIEGNEEQKERVTEENILRFSNAVATYAKKTFNELSPIIGATLPNGSRIQIVRPPAIDSKQFSITIRKPSLTSFDLEFYKKNNFFKKIIANETNKDEEKLKELFNQKDYVGFLDFAVKAGEKNIVVVGETGSGKTTLMKTLIKSIDLDERLITIEDTREVFLKHDNAVNLLYPDIDKSKITPTVLLKSCLRMRPDRIILSELRGAETFDYINAISSGHGGSITSLHAGSVDEAFRRMVLMFLQNETGSTIPYETVEKIIRATIDIVIVIKVSQEGRFVSEFYWKEDD